MLNVQTLPDGQLPHRFKLMKEAEKKPATATVLQNAGCDHL
jgi:hypothetical protein